MMFLKLFFYLQDPISGQYQYIMNVERGTEFDNHIISMHQYKLKLNYKMNLIYLA